MVYSTTGEYDKAIADFDKAIQLDSKCINAYKGKGDLYNAKEDYDKAVTNYKRVIILDPTDSITANNMENSRKAFEKQQQERKEKTKKRVRSILCVSAPILAVFSALLVFIFIFKAMENDQYSDVYSSLVFSIIPFLVIFFSDSDSKLKRIIFLIMDIVYFIIIFKLYGTIIDVNFYFVMAVITNLVSVVLATLYPKDRWYYF